MRRRPRRRPRPLGPAARLGPRAVPIALGAAALVLLWPARAHAHYLSGGPPTGPEIAALATGLAAALAGWLILARSRSRPHPAAPWRTRAGYALFLIGLLIFLGGPEIAGSIADYASSRRQAPALGGAARVVTLRWSDWTWDPLVIAGLGVTALAWWWTARRFRPRRWQPVFFWAGMLGLVAALLSPIDAGSEYLFTIHMVQHMLLMLVVPPLFALAVPPALLGKLYQQPGIARVLRAVWAPFPALLLFNGVLVFWHLPFAYDATLNWAWVHAVEHLSFLASGLVFWGVIASPAPKLVRASFGLRLGLVVAADLVNFLVGFALAFAGGPFYRHYTQVPRLWGLSPLDDLHLGGGVMWVMGQMMYAIPVLILLSVLLRRDAAPGASPVRSIPSPHP